MRRPWRPPALEPAPLAPADVVAALLRAAIAADGSACWRATGRSMGASIRDGQAVRLIAPDPERLREGEVVMAVLPEGRLALHRVASVDGTRLVLRGDANRHADRPIDSDAVVGVVDPTPPFPLRSRALRLVP